MELRIRVKGADKMELDDLLPFQGELKELTEHNFNKLKNVLTDQGFQSPFHLWKDDKGDSHILDGHQRRTTLLRLREDEGWAIPPLPVVWVEADSLKEAKKTVLTLTSQYGVMRKEGFNKFIEENEIDVGWAAENTRLIEVDIPDIAKGAGKGEFDPSGHSSGDPGSRKGALAERFVVPPFSVLDTRQGYWQQRRKNWMYKIDDKGESRQGTLAPTDSGDIMAGVNKGVSILDPVLAEAMCTWFGWTDGLTLDPFAGDTVFGYVSKWLGHNFVGIELREEQAKLNQDRCDSIDYHYGPQNGAAKYINDSSENIDKYLEDETVDFLFSCPPYYDLEVYSDLDNDLSNQPTYADFREMIRGILKKACAKLKENRFAVITVGEIRGKDGEYYGFVNDIIEIMRSAGLHYYNDIILLNAIGTAHMRAQNYMRGRKVPKIHQNVLVFFKGDLTKIKEIYPKFEVQYTVTGKEELGAEAPEESEE